jgi:hypothetical protein
VRPTNEQIARGWDLWREYIDTEGVMSAEEFHGMDIAARVALIKQVFGPEKEIEGEDA